MAQEVYETLLQQLQITDREKVAALKELLAHEASSGYFGSAISGQVVGSGASAQQYPVGVNVINTNNTNPLSPFNVYSHRSYPEDVKKALDACLHMVCTLQQGIDLWTVKFGTGWVMREVISPERLAADEMDWVALADRLRSAHRMEYNNGFAAYRIIPD